MKRIIISLAFLIFILSVLQSEKSIVILFDSSFSMKMGTTTNNLQRIELAKKAVYRILTNTKIQDAYWALITLGTSDDGTDKPELRQGFTKDKTLIINQVNNLRPWGRSRIDNAIDYSYKYLTEQGKGKDRSLVLLSDLIETGGPNPLFESYAETIYNLITKYPIFIVWFPTINNGRLNQETEEVFKELSALKPGFINLFTYHTLDKLLRGLSKPIYPQTRQIEGATFKEAKEKNYLNPFTIILAVFILISAVLILTIVIFKPGRVEKRFSGLEYQMELEIVSSKGERKRVRFVKSPVTIGTGVEEDLYLPHPGKHVKKLSCTIHFDNNTATFKSPVPFVVNGVERKEKKLKEGNFFRFGSYKIYYRGIITKKIFTKVKKPPIALFILFFGFFLVVSAFTLVVLPRETKNNLDNTVQIAKPQKTEKKTNNLKKLKIQKRPNIERFNTRMYSPGEKIDYFKADILFIHAHPDDESLDFGCLMADAARKGKKIVTLLFTDGEGGIDQYPNRIIADMYPAKKLSGKSLSSARVLEAKDALSILGSSAYIRLGYKNHPYNSITEVLSVSRVLDDWGGEKNVIGRLKRIIKGFSPDLIVAPDKHSKAFEHFEHETVGYVVDMALSQLEKEGFQYPKGYIVSVDPLQKNKYVYITGINAMNTDSKNNITYREIQARALLQHITQRDASVIGVDILPNFEKEYYHIIKWKIKGTLENYIDK